MEYLIDRLLQKINYKGYRAVECTIAHSLITEHMAILDYSLVAYCQKYNIAKSTLLRFMNNEGFKSFASFKNELEIEYTKVMCEQMETQLLLDEEEELSFLKAYEGLSSNQSLLTESQLMMFLKQVKAHQRLFICTDLEATGLLSGFQKKMILKGKWVYFLNLVNWCEIEDVVSMMNADDLVIMISPEEDYKSYIESNRFKKGNVIKFLSSFKGDKVFFGFVSDPPKEVDLAINIDFSYNKLENRKCLLDVFNYVERHTETDKKSY